MDAGHLSDATCCRCQQRHLGMPHGVYKGGVGVNIGTHTHPPTHPAPCFLKTEPKYLIVAVGEFSALSTGQVLIAVI